MHSINSLEQQIDYIKNKASTLGNEHILPAEFGFNHFNIWKHHNVALFKYAPSDYYGSIVFFSPNEMTLGFPINNYSHWIKLAKGEFKNFSVPGNHTSMNFNPNVEIIIQTLKRSIAEESYKKLNI